MIYISVVSFAIGILIKEFLNIDIGTIISICLTSVVVSIVLWKDNQRFSKLILAVSFFLFLGVLRMGLVDNFPDSELISRVNEEVSFIGLVNKEPDIRDNSIRYTVSTEFDSDILLIADRFPELKYGDKISVSGKLSVPENFTGDTDVLFDYVSYLKKDGVHFLVYYPEIEKIGESKTGKMVSGIYSIKYHFISRIERVVPEPNASLLSGMIFGVKQSLGTKLLDQFKKVGLIHIVVLSGQNVTLVALGIYLFTSYFLDRNKSLFLSAVFIIIFALMVGFSATVLRASIMALIAILARFLGRPQFALHFLFVAAFLMIIWNPLTLPYDPSFHLSFLATFGLIVFTPFVQKFISERFSFVTEKFEVREIVSSTLAVQLFILPVLIKMSGQVSIVSFFINPIILPFVMPLMLLGISIGFIGLVPVLGFYLSWPLGALSYFLTEIIFRSVSFASHLPFSTLSIPSLPIYIIILWYLFYAFLFHYLNKRKNDHPGKLVNKIF